MSEAGYHLSMCRVSLAPKINDDANLTRLPSASSPNSAFCSTVSYGGTSVPRADIGRSLVSRNRCQVSSNEDFKARKIAAAGWDAGQEGSAGRGGSAPQIGLQRLQLRRLSPGRERPRLGEIHIAVWPPGPIRPIRQTDITAIGCRSGRGAPAFEKGGRLACTTGVGGPADLANNAVKAMLLQPRREGSQSRTRAGHAVG